MRAEWEAQKDAKSGIAKPESNTTRASVLSTSTPPMVEQGKLGTTSSSELVPTN